MFKNQKCFVNWKAILIAPRRDLLFGDIWLRQLRFECLTRKKKDGAALIFATGTSRHFFVRNKLTPAVPFFTIATTDGATIKFELKIILLSYPWFRVPLNAFKHKPAQESSRFDASESTHASQHNWITF